MDSNHTLHHDSANRTSTPEVVNPVELALPLSPNEAGEHESAQEVADSEEADDHDDDDDDDDDDTASVTSAMSAKFHGHERLDIYGDKVTQVLATHFPSRAFRLQRIKGGSFNRIVGVTIPPSEVKPQGWKWVNRIFQGFCGQYRSQKPENYIVRIPRAGRNCNMSEMRYDVAVLSFAGSQLPYPVPRVKYANYTSENALESPYTIQQWLPGQNLAPIQSSLTIEQNVSLTCQVMDIHRKLQTVTSPCAGIINYYDAPQTSPSLSQFRVPKNIQGAATFLAEKPATFPAAPQTTFDLLIDLCNRQEELDKVLLGWPFTAWAHFRNLVRSMQKRGLLPDTDPFYFCHLDLLGRNILVSTPDDQTANIEGVLDWDADYACFCPKFVAYKAPFWLWVDEDKQEEDEVFADITPEKPSMIEAKKLFTETAGEEWIRYAFMPEYQIARKMFLVMKTGMQDPRCHEWADEVYAAWKELHPEDDLDDFELGSDSDSDSD